MCQELIPRVLLCLNKVVQQIVVRSFEIVLDRVLNLGISHCRSLHATKTLVQFCCAVQVS